MFIDMEGYNVMPVFLRMSYVVLALFFLAACGDQAATPTSVPVTPSPIATPTIPPTPSPTIQAKPVPTTAIVGPAVLGSSLAAFIAAYGQPGDHTDKANGSYHF